MKAREQKERKCEREEKKWGGERKKTKETKAERRKEFVRGGTTLSPSQILKVQTANNRCLLNLKILHPTLFSIDVLFTRSTVI